MNIQIGHDAALVESKKKLISGTYLRNAWYVAAWSEAVGDGGVLGLTILKEPVVLYRQSNGEVAALEDRCAHRFRALEHGAHRRRQPHPVPLSRARIRQDRRLRAQSARQQEHSVARAREELSGDREAQGDLDLDGRPAGRSVQDSGLQRDGQRAGAAHHQARQDHGQGQLRAGDRQPARPLPHLVSARRHSSATPTRSSPTSASTRRATTSWCRATPAPASRPA